MARRRTWWGNPALRQAIALTEGGGYDADAAALFARATTQPTAADKAAINTAVLGYKAAGLWSKFDGFWCIGADTAQFAQRNWVQDAYNLTPVNSPAFTVKGGYKGDASSSYIQFGVNQNALSKFTQDSAHLMVWAVELPTTAGGASAEIGIYSGTDRARLRFTDGAGGSGKSAMRLNQASTDSAGVGITRGTGMLLGSRTGAATSALYRNNDESTTYTTASAALTASAMGLLQGIGGSYSNARIVAASIGSGLSAAEKSSVYSITFALLTAMGVPTS